MIYSIVIPVYNSGAWLPELTERLINVMKTVEPSCAWEIILVNDCSPDMKTWPIIKQLSERSAQIKGLDLLYNVGQFKATLCGFEHAKGKFIITLDDDLQHPPEELPKLINAMVNNPTIMCVMGKFPEKKHNLIRNMGSYIRRWLLFKLFNKSKHIKTTAFRLMRRELADAIVRYKTSKPQLGVLITTLTKEIVNVEVEHHSRKQGKSGYSMVKLISLVFDNIIYGSTVPLKFFSLLGLFIALSSFGLMVYYFFRWLWGNIGLPGFATQTLLITFFGGMIMAGIGLLGEYIARIITEIAGPERYVVKEIVDE